MLAALFDVMPHVTWLYATDPFRVAYINVAFERVFGRARAILDGDPLAWVDAVHEEDRAGVRAELAARVGGAEPRSLAEFRVTQASGEVRLLRSSVRRFESTGQGGERVIQWIETALDVTRERAMAAVARRDHEIATQVLDVLRAVIVVADRQGRIVEWNDRFAQLYVHDIASMRGRLVSSVVSPSGDALASFTRSQEVIVGEGRYHIGNRRVQAPDGELRELDWWAGPLHDAAGEISGYLGVARDVTVENRSRRAHALSEERFGKLLQNLPDVPWLYSLDDERFLYVGPGFEELWGRLPPSGFGGADRLVEWVHPQDRAAVDALAQAVRRGEAWVGDVEARVVRPDGSIRWAVSRIVPILDDEGRVVEAAGYTADITARRETERALRESEERLRLIAETTRDVFFLVSADRSKVYYVNPAFERVWGLPCEALYADPRLFLKRMHPDDRASVASAIARQIAAGEVPAEMLLEYRIVRPDGAVRWLSSRTYSAADEDGSSTMVVGLATDITDRKEAEQALRERTEQLERTVREKNVLLAELHHRVKNNLQSICGLMHLMAARSSVRPIHETMQELEQRIQAMALVHEILYRSSSLQDVDMQAYLERLTHAQLAAHSSAGRSIQLRVRAHEITLDPDGALRCGLIVNELVSNSLKHAFGQRGGCIDVSMERAGDHLVLRVADDGKGLPARPDFASEATLGLRLVQGLAEQLGGSARRVPGVAGAIEVAFSPVSPA